MQARHTILSEEIVTDAARIAARVFWTPTDVSQYVIDRTASRDVNTAISSAGLTSPVRSCDSTTGSPSRAGNQDIILPRGSIVPQWRS